MSFVPLDGFSAGVCAPVKGQDNSLLISQDAVGALALITPGDFTWLLLNDGISQEVVKYAPAQALTNYKNKVVVPIDRSLSRVRYNFGPGTVLFYGFCTNIIAEVVRAINAENII